ncbi:MAG: GNAT family N-acetyltransferase [Candidatus Thiodiazotropha sp. (ex Notomyrtea botanica)]|nr:GNAT family N-acetyltransferase [Candidatus Thiodiazotropha sp. (ex Notomyrtea botanica)]
MCTIRQAMEGDYPAICDLITSKSELFRIYPRGSYPFTIEQLSQLAKSRQDLTVVIQDDAVVGFANLYDVEPDNRAFVGNVIVSVDLRGRGIGRQLMQYMVKLAFVQYRPMSVAVSVFSDNIPALLLYTDLGFKPYAVERRIDPEGKPAALIHMHIDSKGEHARVY